MNKIILEELRSILLDRTDLQNLPENLWKRSAALNTWGTNAIEGSTITLKEAEKILVEERSVGNKPLRDVLETIQHERAFRSITELRKYPFTLETVLFLHEQVFKGILMDAGQWQRVNVRISGAKFRPPRMEKVLRELEEWQKEYSKQDLEDVDVFELNAWMHFNFERIHPFADGNGRVGRLIMNLLFLKHNWPPIHVLPVDRDEYLDSLNSCSLGDLVPLEKLMMKLMGSSLLDLLDQLGTSDDELMDLKEASDLCPYDNKYLALRCKQGELPGVLKWHKWHTSKRALDSYISNTAR